MTSNKKRFRTSTKSHSSALGSKFASKTSPNSTIYRARERAKEGRKGKEAEAKSLPEGAEAQKRGKRMEASSKKLIHGHRGVTVVIGVVWVVGFRREHSSRTPLERLEN